MDIQKAKETINHWVGQDVLLIKEEDGDVDETIISLNDVTFVERKPTIDGYVLPRALQLHGSGYVVLEDRNAPLPNDAYDIPLSEDLHIHTDEGALLIETSRASYTIAPQ